VPPMTRIAHHLASTSVQLAVPRGNDFANRAVSSYFAWGCFAKSNSVSLPPQRGRVRTWSAKKGPLAKPRHSALRAYVVANLAGPVERGASGALSWRPG
jgi:hypothetical protein